MFHFHKVALVHYLGEMSMLFMYIKNVLPAAVQKL